MLGTSALAGACSAWGSLNAEPNVRPGQTGVPPLLLFSHERPCAAQSGFIKMKKENGQRLPQSFFTREDVVQVAKDLLGKHLVTFIDGQMATGKIVETEAYRAPEDKASHAWNNRRTLRTETMFAEGGVAYVYLCYGIHHLFNVVTGPEGTPHAVLIRGVEPVENVEIMLLRRKMGQLRSSITAGPGALAQALGIRTSHNGAKLYTGRPPIWLEDRSSPVAEADITASPRVGVAYAGECAAWPWRFRIKGSPWASPAK